MNKALWRATLLAGLMVGGLLAGAQAPAADSDHAALEAATQRWVVAVNMKDAAVLTATMTEDVELIDEKATVTGRDAVIRALREDATRGQLVAMSREMTISSDVAWHVVALTQNQKNGIVQARGQALEIWKRVKGEWKLHRRVVAGAGINGVLLTRPSTKEPVLDRPGLKQSD